METELKFRVIGRVRPRQIERLDLGPYRLRNRQAHRLRDLVLDTADRAITGRMHGLRVRRDGESVYVTLKGPGRAVEGGRHAREELEVAIDRAAALTPEQWPDPVRRQVQELIGTGTLEPIIEIANNRRSWEVCQDERLVAELALDEGEIRVGGQVMPLHEIEVELKGDGRDEDLDNVARRLRQALLLADEPRTKLARGLELIAVGAAGGRPRDRDVKVAPEADLAEAGRTILRRHFKQLRSTEQGVRKGDVESVHDMRVAIRRIRAVLEVLGGTAYDPALARSLRRGLKQLAASLGSVRDVEVWMQNVDAYASGLDAGERSGLVPLQQALRARREANRAAMLGELGGKRTRRLLEEVERLVSTPGAGVLAQAEGLPGMPRRVRDAAGSALWARLEAVQAFGPVMPHAPVPVMHELRIACKRLRYTLELFAGALGDEAKALRNEIVAAQENLGMLNDADVAIPLLDGLCRHDAANAALQRYRSHLVDERDRLWEGAAGIWAIVGGQAFRERLARVVAAL